MDAPEGIRSLRLDPEHGLRINGETVKLRGACVHHDNGPLGAATFARAEERRVRLLKDAGFNAIRMSHHPMSTAMLDACDRLGMLVVDEAFDMWTWGTGPVTTIESGRGRTRSRPAGWRWRMSPLVLA
ncbi:glycoside hydrolase family 2 TIM barrel-domain containing protein [Nonomuraea sp. B19D2]|uniref:glycoside hydrolase family 2 TIM barrel-domain containing protein n=1 Tax=Nonomuraea sp. B19D2 TaxID=3159561 RepID=UPI0032DB3F27